MATTLKQYSGHREYLDLADPEAIVRLQVECNTLRYLQTYPAVVLSKIREKEFELRVLNSELDADLNSCTSKLAKIKRKQALEPRYAQLKLLRRQLEDIKGELVEAEQVKLVAVTRLQIYQNLLADKGEGGFYQ